MDHYAILGIEKNATKSEVRQAYMRLVRERHPDRFTDPAQKEEAQEFFKRLTEAFNTLSNDKSREEYDRECEAGPRAVPAEIAAAAHAEALGKLQQRAFHEAVSLLRTAVQNAPEVGQYHADLGRALANNPHWTREAIDQLDQALQLEPKNAGYHLELARILAGQGLRLRALRAAETALRYAPENSAVKKLVSELRAAGGQEPDSGAPRRKA